MLKKENSFENILDSLRGKPNSIETNDRKEIVDKIFTNFSSEIIIKRYSRYQQELYSQEDSINFFEIFVLNLFLER